MPKFVILCKSREMENIMNSIGILRFGKNREKFADSVPRKLPLQNYQGQCYKTFYSGNNCFTVEQAALNKSSLLLKNILQNTQTLLLFKMNI
jgi:hypothetical protein